MVGVVLFPDALPIPLTLVLNGCAHVVLSDFAGMGAAVYQSVWLLDTLVLQIGVGTPEIAPDILQVMHLE